MSRIAFISTAHIHTRDFLNNLRSAGDGRSVVAIWDDHEERGQRYATEYGAVFVADLDVLLARPDVDGFAICSENTAHLSLLRKALATGKPVFSDKPILTNAEQLPELEKLLNDSTSPVLCGYFMPYSAQIQGLQRFLETEEAGIPTRARAITAHHAAYGRWFDGPDLQWFTKPELAGGGGFMDMGNHAVHLLRTLFGPGKVIAADIRNHSGLYPEVDDAGIAILQFDSGVVGIAEGSWIRNGGAGGLEVQTTRGAIVFTGDAFEFQRPKQSPMPIPAEDAKPHRMDRFVACIRGEIPAEELRKDLEIALDTVRLMSGAYDAGKRESH